ncbi:MAG: glycosyltransferase [Terracoccus sp.]
MDPGPQLDAVRTAPTLLEGMHAAPALAAAAANADEDTVAQLRSAAATSDPVTAIAAVHALAACGHPSAGQVLADLMADHRPFVAEHAVDALRHTPPVSQALPGLVRACHDGGFTAMLAQRTLERWATAEPGLVFAAVTEAVPTATDDGARMRLVETLGLVPGPASTRALLGIGADDSEPHPVRAAALAALGDGPAADRCAEELLVSVARGVGPLAETARLALHDLCPPPGPLAPDGLTVAQLFLHSDIDGQLHHSGRGDTGGIATLLVTLGDALLRQHPQVGRVLTISGGRPDPAHFPIGRGPSPLDGPAPASALLAAGHHYARVPIPASAVGAARAWSARVATRRGIRRILRSAGRVDAVHLRMADVGSMAAADVANELDVPIVLTVAPDPQALIDARDAAGTLTREGFGDADLVEHLWFRDHLLRDLAARAEHLVLFPRPQVEQDLRRYLGIELSDQPGRASVIGEGIDVAAVDRMVREVGDEAARGPQAAAALEELGDLLSSLPDDRRSLPLVVSVGRLNAVKGMATLVRGWQDDVRLRDRCNLLIIGGDLEDPTDEEATELARIDAVVPAADATARGLLLAGHRPNATTLSWLAAARQGCTWPASPPGVYVSASLKEEFGIAILEAMAVGLVVVAPQGGGPATYVSDGEDGILVDTSTPGAVAAATHAALDLAVAPGADVRERQARNMVRTRYSIDAMAASLASVYRQVTAQSHPVSVTLRDVVEGAS